jgi:hypothetical protein
MYNEVWLQGAIMRLLIAEEKIRNDISRKDNKTEDRVIGVGETAWECVVGVQDARIFERQLLQIQGIVRQGRS